MHKQNTFLTIIPARAGSKRIPNKNMKLIGKKPMIQYTIEAAISSVGKSNILVSSDDAKIIKLAKNLGLKIPFVRPKYLSTNKTSTSSVILHAIKWFKNKNKFLPNNILLLQPTSPFRTSIDIKKSIKKFLKSKKNTLISASVPIQNPHDFLFKNKKGKYEQLKKILETNIDQKKKAKIYFIDGGIYISKTSQFIKSRSLVDENPEIYLTNQLSALDVDTPFDLKLARIVHINKFPE